MDSNEIRESYLKFFKKHGHALIPPAPLVPPDDPTTLFTSSGMQQLVPYLKGELHPKGKRLVDSQPCFRANDIDEVGDNRHTTFFEMLGNWSLGDYFKEDQLNWFWEWLTDELELSKDRLHVTIFDGDKSLQRKTRVSQSLAPDVTSKSIWLKTGVPEPHIHWYGSDKNWWSRSGAPEDMPVGEIGGPDSEVFYDFDPEGKLKIHQNSKWSEKSCHPNCDCGRFLEIGNSVFMEFEKQGDGVFKPLPKQNVDFGGGLERLAAAVQNTPDVFMIDLFSEAIKSLEVLKKSGGSYRETPKPYRIIVDHLRAAIFMVAEGVEPSNKERGYILRRLIRRSMVYARKLGMVQDEWLSNTLPPLASPYVKTHPLINQKIPEISQVITQEVDRFRKTINKGIAALKKIYNMAIVNVDPENLPPGMVVEGNKIRVDGNEVFKIYETYGLNPEISQEIMTNWGLAFDEETMKECSQAMEQHRVKSRTASAGMFKGGLANRSEITTKYHTATHLLQAALRQVLGRHVRQEGSNITAERLRFDFSHPQALSDEEMKRVEELINQKIKADLPVVKTIEDKEAALTSGAMAFFRENYPDKVSVYTIGDFSKELCGGPHVGSTAAIGSVKLIKQESIGAGKRRVYAVLNYGTKKSTGKIHQQRSPG